MTSFLTMLTVLPSLTSMPPCLNAPLPQPVNVEEELPEYDEEAGDVNEWVNNVVQEV